MEQHENYKEQAKEAYETCQGGSLAPEKPLETLAPEKPLGEVVPCDAEEKEQNWYFTFGSGQDNEGKCYMIKGTFDSARKKMFERFGSKWSFQYSQESYNTMLLQGYYFPVIKHTPDEE